LEADLRILDFFIRSSNLCQVGLFVPNEINVYSGTPGGKSFMPKTGKSWQASALYDKHPRLFDEMF
jgi:hypothetical protein